MAVMTTIYHVNDGPVEMYEIDTLHALRLFKNEWSKTPWAQDGKAEREREIADLEQRLARLRSIES